MRGLATIEETADGPTAWSRIVRLLRVAAFALAVASIGATFLLVTGLIDIPLTEQRVAFLVIGTSAVAGVLLIVVLVDVFRLFRQWRQGLAGARLHIRIVGLFTLIAAVPAILIAVVASVPPW